VEHSEHDGILATYAATLPDPEKILRADNLITTPSSKGRLEMNGPAVFKKAIITLSQTIFKLLQIAQLSEDAIDWVVPHQANMRILQAVAERTPIPFDKYYCCVERYGNTSAASIAIALGECCEKQHFKKGDKVLLVAFGAGLAHGGVIFEYQGY
jgi:3-oxoacyl-[acyl-carrier-protein] synthase-3